MACPVRTLWPLGAQVLTSTADGDGLSDPGWRGRSLFPGETQEEVLPSSPQGSGPHTRLGPTQPVHAGLRCSWPWGPAGTSSVTGGPWLRRC